MNTKPTSTLDRLLCALVGRQRTDQLFDMLEVSTVLTGETGPRVSRGVLAQALTMVLFGDLLARAPSARAHLRDRLKNGEKVVHDHSVVATIASPHAGSLPSGREALGRVLVPLGFVESGSRRSWEGGITEHTYLHAEHPDEIAGFVVVEVHPHWFSRGFQAAAERVVRSSRDPLAADTAWLAALSSRESVELVDAVAILRALVACFDRQHATPSLDDYDLLMRESAEMAWIATEGNAVMQVAQRAARSKTRGQAALSGDASEPVDQLVLEPASVERPFRDSEGRMIGAPVPGPSFKIVRREARKFLAPTWPEPDQDLAMCAALA